MKFGIWKIFNNTINHLTRDVGWAECNEAQLSRLKILFVGLRLTPNPAYTERLFWVELGLSRTAQLGQDPPLKIAD